MPIMKLWFRLVYNCLQERESELDRLAEKLKPAVKPWRSGHPGYELDVEDFIRRGRERNAAKHGQV